MKKLLLLHGAIGAKDQLDPLKKMLSKSFRVYSFSFSGHGESDFKKGFDIDQFTADTLSFLSSNNLAKVCIFGYSMGGYVALNLAKNYPEKVEQIVTFGTKFKWSPAIAQKEVKMLDASIIANKVPAFAKALSVRHGTKWKALLLKTTDMMLAMGAEAPLKLSDYKNIPHNCKLMLAESDEMVTKEETLAVVNALPKASFQTIPKAKHSIEKVDLLLLSKEIAEAM